MPSRPRQASLLTFTVLSAAALVAVSLVGSIGRGPAPVPTEGDLACAIQERLATGAQSAASPLACNPIDWESLSPCDATGAAMLAVHDSPDLGRFLARLASCGLGPFASSQDGASDPCQALATGASADASCLDPQAVCDAVAALLQGVASGSTGASASSDGLPCGIDSCDYVGNLPGFCGNPLPSTDPC